MRVLAVLCLAGFALADDQTQKMTTRVSEEAEAFRKIATQVLGTEKLHQAAMKPPSRFHPRIGNGAPPPPQWKERDLVSEYGFASFGGDSSAIHELRQVVSMDGRKVEETKKAQDALAKAITATDDARKKEVMKQLEKFGLTGAVTDFGQLLLLFGRREIERYEFTFKGATMIGYDRALVFSYKQLDGPEAVTLVEANKSDHTERLKMEGEIRVRATDYVPLQITMTAREGDGADALREEAAVTYAMSPYGALLPVSTEHREMRGGKVVAENHFSYTEFHRFGASSDVKFEVAK
ncbi:MAG: hypothetical protein LAO79_18405 [Acidobacteriia bacterium]|nr:hypothetical protein [Terriglobia bacterium]